MRFVFLSYVRTPAFDQPEVWLHRLRAYTGVLEALAKRHEVISIEQIAYKGVLRQNGVQYHFADMKNSCRHFPFLVHRLAKQMQPDVVVVHGTCFPLQVWQLRRVLGRKARIVVQDHSPGPPEGFRGWLQRRADNAVDTYLFTSAAMARPWLQRGLITDASRIAEIMVGSSVFQEGSRQAARMVTGAAGTPVFLWVGRLDANKDPLTTVAAFLRYCDSTPSARLYMIYQGDELLPKLQAKLDSDRNSGQVCLVGGQPHAALENWFNSADFLLAASHSEVYGAAVVEAVSCGCIPVLSDIPSFRKITGDGYCGLHFEPGNEASLLQCLMTLRAMDTVAEKQKLREHYARSLSFTAIAASIEKAVSLAG